VENRTSTTCDLSTEQHMSGTYILYIFMYVFIYLFIMVAASLHFLLDLTYGSRFVTAVCGGTEDYIDGQTDRQTDTLSTFIVTLIKSESLRYNPGFAYRSGRCRQPAFLCEGTVLS